MTSSIVDGDQADLFFDLPRKANEPATFPMRCVCGKSFQLQVRKRGRPIRFCGDTCRRFELAKQKRAWAKRQPSSRPLS